MLKLSRDCDQLMLDLCGGSCRCVMPPQAPVSVSRQSELEPGQTGGVLDLKDRQTYVFFNLIESPGVRITVAVLVGQNENGFAQCCFHD